MLILSLVIYIVKGYVSEGSEYHGTSTGQTSTKGEFKCKYCFTKFNLDRSLPKHVKRKHPSEYKKGRPTKEYLAVKG